MRSALARLAVLCVVAGATAACDSVDDTPPRPAGAWEQAAVGGEEGRRYEIYVASARPRGTCYSVELVPPPSDAFAPSSLVIHDNRGVTLCTIFGRRFPTVLRTSEGSGDPRLTHHVTYGESPIGVDGITAVLDDGTESVHEPGAGMYVVTYPVDRSLARLRFAVASHVLDCGVDLTVFPAAFDCEQR